MTATCPQCGAGDLTPAQNYCYHCGATLLHPTVPRTANIVGDGALPASVSEPARAATPFGGGAPHYAPPFSTAVLRSISYVLVPIIIGIGALAFLTLDPHHLHNMHGFMAHMGQMEPGRLMGALGAARLGEFLVHLLPLLFFGLLIFGRYGSGPRGGRLARRARRFARRASHDARRGITWL